MSDANREYVAALAERDEELGRQLAARFGRATAPRRSVPYRIVRRLVFELKKLAGPLAKRVLRGSERRWNRSFGDRKRIANGSHHLIAGYRLEVHALRDDGVLDTLAATQAEYWVLTRHAGQLLADAMPHLTQALSAPGEIQLWFGDSRSPAGVRERRSEFNRLLLRQVDVLGPAVLCSVAALRELAERGVIPELWPLALGLTLPSARIQLIREVLAIGSVAEVVANEHAEQAAELVRAELRSSGYEALVQVSAIGRRDVSYALNAQPTVSIVIPTRGSAHEGRVLVIDAVRSLIEKSSYPHIELVIVADEPTPQAVVDEIDTLAAGRVRWVRWSEPFHFSAKMNLGAAAASGEVLLFLNDDVEVVSTDWIEQMLSLIGIDGIGYVGALLFFADSTIQHAGHFYAGGAGHIGIEAAFELRNPNQLFQNDRVVSGVTAACSLITRHRFDEAGGFSLGFPGNYNDVDLGLKLGELGSTLAVAGRARLYHFESKTRDARVLRSELLALHQRWYARIQADPYWRHSEGL